MGYLTWYNIRQVSGPDEDYDSLLKDIENECGVMFEAESAEAKWYDSHADMVRLTRRYPDLTVELSGEGEGSDDRWASRYRGGESESVKAEMPDFHTLATHAEREHYVRDTYETAKKRLVDVIADFVADEPAKEIRHGFILSDDGLHRKSITRLWLRDGELLYDERITECREGQEVTLLASTGIAEREMTVEEAYTVAKALTEDK